MAGIGFKLRKIFEKDTYLDNLRGVIFSASIAGGPIFFSILCLVLLGIFSAAFLRSGEMSIFLITVVYVFAFSLISTGLSQLLITRFLSDLIYASKFRKILPTFTVVLTITIVCQLIIGLPFFLFWNIGFNYKLAALMLFIVIGCIWQLMIFLSAVKNYQIVMYAFATGLTISFFAAYTLGKAFGLTGFLHGYTFGQVILLFILLIRIFIEFKSDDTPNFEIASYIGKMPQLIAIGFFYNLGIWVDKIIFWFSDKGEQVHDMLYVFTDYDGAMFIAYMTTIPAYTYFLVKIETNFYSRFRIYYESILNKNTLARIYQNKSEIAKSVRESIGGLLKIQGTVTLVCLLFSDEIAAFLKLPGLGAIILDKALIAVFLQMMLLTIMIFMMYFDMASKLVKVASVFLGANVLLTGATLHLGYVFFGYGYLCACLLALIAGYVFLNKHLNELEYHTFTTQPITT